jgi:hypothetical protein
MKSSMVMTPGGPRLRSLVRLIEPGGTVDVSKRVQTMIRGDRRPGRPDSANWISAGWIDLAGAPFVSFSTTWEVPPAPRTTASQLLYLFSGMQPADASTIIQPVLQWGDSGADLDGQNRTGPFWTIASWIVPAPDGITYHTPHERVRTNDVLTGVITMLNSDAVGFYYSCEFAGRLGTRFVTPGLPQMAWGVEVLEAYEPNGTANPPYDLDSSSEYPATDFTAFKSITIHRAPTGRLWTQQNYVTTYGEHTKIAIDSLSDGEIQIYYGTDKNMVASAT